MALGDWNKVNRIFNAALRREPEERRDFLTSECAGDEELRREVESLLSSYSEADSFLEAPAVSEVAGSFVSESGRLEEGEEFGRYRIIRLIGKGGMGEVYLAEDHQLHRRVALKTLPLHFGHQTERMKRFELEALAVSSLNHPNILTIYEIGEHEGVQFISTEYVEGKPLTEYCSRRDCRLTDILDIFTQLLSGLSAAHRAGIVHRDIKPENLMVRDDGYLKILDFGVAKLKGRRTRLKAEQFIGPRSANITDGRTVLGTASYMSPEQARGEAADERSDIWSAGVVLYELITGTRPFAGDTPANTIASILNEDALPISSFEKNVPVDLERVVGRALKKDVEERFQSARDFQAALEAIEHKIEFEEELERSGIPGGPDVSTRRTGRETGEEARGRTTGKVGLGSGGIRGRKVAFAAFIPVLIVGLIAAGYIIFRDNSPVLTDKDVILLSDFENITGEEIFDGALRQGLLLQLRQSPFLSIYPDSGVQDTLALMKREPDTPITRDLAGEICQRRGLKAFLVGTISKFGGNYVVGIEAVNASTGAIVAVSQAEVENKEDVLGALSLAATEMRLQLGESLATITEYDDPLPEVTTSSLEALKAYAMGVENLSEKEEARALFQQAIDLDPEFAAAYMRLGDTYDQTQVNLQRAAFRKAYELRDKISERERIAIQEIHYHLLDPDLDKMIEFLKASKVKYPRDAGIWTGLARGHYLQGKYEEAVREAEEALKIEPGAQFALSHLGASLLKLNRIEEARNAILKYRAKPDEQAEKLFDIAFIQNDEEGMKAQLEILRKKGDTDAIRFEAEAFAARGEWRRSKAVAAPVVSQVKEIDSKAFLVFQRQVFLAAQLGMCEEARELSGRMLSFPKDELGAGIMRTFTRMMARCGDITRARELNRTLAELYPKFRGKVVTDALLEAEIDLWRGDARAALKHLESLDDVVFRKYELRARAYLMLDQNEEALADYQHILNNPGKLLCTPLYPLAQLGKARATGNKAEYEKFFEMWKYADEDLPELVAARKEYRELTSRTTGSARDEATPLPSANPRPLWSSIFRVPRPFPARSDLQNT